MFGLDSVFSTLSQGGLGSLGGSGSDPSSAISGVSGPTTLGAGGITINKADQVPYFVLAGIVLILVVVMAKRK